MNRFLCVIFLAGCSSSATQPMPVGTAPKQGVIELHDSPYQGQWGGFAMVWFSTYDGTPSVCTQRTVAGCVVETCAPTDGGTGTGRKSVSVGAVTVSGVQLAAPLMQNVQGVYSGSIQSPWTAGQALGVSATGDVVPAFAYSTKAPGNVVVAPVGSVIDDPTQGLTVTWTSDIPSALMFYVGVLGSSTLAPVRCTASSSTTSGQYTVPAEVLALFPGATGMQVTAESRTTTDAMLGDWPVTMSAFSDALDVNGQRWQLDASFR